MSALPPEADMCSASGHVCFGPKADMALFDHLVGACKDRRRNGDAKRLRGLEVDDQFVFCRCLHRHVGWLFTLKDAINIRCGSPLRIISIRSVGDQTAIYGPIAIGIN